ncbi:MAG: hypothetical protein RL030_1752 [Pseudomonadota bacterium]
MRHETYHWPQVGDHPKLAQGYPIRHPRVPLALVQQALRQQAAEACTELGADAEVPRLIVPRIPRIPEGAGILLWALVGALTALAAGVAWRLS